MIAASDASSGFRGDPRNGRGEGGGWRDHRCGFAFGWKPVELLAMVLGFMVFWPIGLAVIGWKFWQKKSHYTGDFTAFAEGKWRSATQGFGRAARGERWRPFTTGNTAFDDWKAAEFARLDEERRKLDEAQRAFADHLNRLRSARDREEFERFMAERRAAQARDPEPPQTPGPTA